MTDEFRADVRFAGLGKVRPEDQLLYLPDDSLESDVLWHWNEFGASRITRREFSLYVAGLGFAGALLSPERLLFAEEKRGFFSTLKKFAGAVIFGAAADYAGKWLSNKLYGAIHKGPVSAPYNYKPRDGSIHDRYEQKRLYNFDIDRNYREKTAYGYGARLPNTLETGHSSFGRLNEYEMQGFSDKGFLRQSKNFIPFPHVRRVSFGDDRNDQQTLTTTIKRYAVPGGGVVKPLYSRTVYINGYAHRGFGISINSGGRISNNVVISPSRMLNANGGYISIRRS